jgi:formimidoylglutamate deiminase
MSADTTRRLFAPHALLPHGWARDVLLAWNDAGTLTEVRVAATAAEGVPRVTGVLVPGLPNLHSHAFQRVFAGLAEHRGAHGDDSFWTWRDLMYRVANAVSPDQLEAIATQLYVEMLRTGYSSVCEFHYLHHDAQGERYAEPAEMALRLLAAARRAGIGITLLPVLYQHAGFGAQPARADQRRFINTTDALLGIVERARTHGARVGVAPHSLRAVGPQALHEVVSGVRAIDASAPIHLHIAEQQREVRDCIAWSGARPVAWLLAHAPVDAHWCLVHATHIDGAERRALAASGAVAGLCPSTEANLGDGVFDAAAYEAANGAWGIGSDSHASVDPFAELRLLEYTQRLAQQRRNVLASAEHPQVADQLWLRAVQGGAQASGRAIGGLAVGQQADFVALHDDGALAGLAPAQLLASHLFANHGRRAVRDAWVAGQHAIRDGAHVLDRVACEHFVAARTELLGRI